MRMPTEIRHVVFSAADATAALRDYCIAAGRPFPIRVAAFSIEGTHDPLVRISGPSERVGEEKSVSFAGEELIAPLLLYCRRKKIPMPLRGEKQLTVLGNQLTLVVKLR
jgi:hypothetical protein